MTPAECTAFLRSDEDDADHVSFFLADKPRGFCTWCDRAFSIFDPDGEAWKVCQCHNYDNDLTEDENRIRYASQRLADAKIEQRVKG